MKFIYLTINKRILGLKCYDLRNLDQPLQITIAVRVQLAYQITDVHGLKPTVLFSSSAAIKSKHLFQYWEHNTRCTCSAKLLTLTICDRN